MDEVDYLILGFGYTAQFLEKLIKSSQPEATIAKTSRTDSSKVIFSLTAKDTWIHLPKAKTLFWTFPAEPLDRVEEFYHSYLKYCKNKIVIGSTSAFLVNRDHQEVNERTPLNSDITRVTGEIFLMEQGCRLVFAGGIYGPGRNPLNWVQKGIIGKSDKFVNMIHVEDLSQILINCSEQGKDGKIYIATDNRPQTWRNVIEAWEKEGLVQDVPEKSSLRRSKKINSIQSLKALNVFLKFPDFKETVIKSKL